jgi:hypothetical protein
MIRFSSLIFFLFTFNLHAQTIKSFGYNTGIPDSVFYKTLAVYNFSNAPSWEETALSIGSKDTNLSGIKDFTNLQYLFFDETFFLNSVNLKRQKTEALFLLLQNLRNLKFISTCDPQLLPYIAKIKTLKGLCCNTFDNSLFNSLKTGFANLELLIVNDPTAETVDVSGLLYLKQLEINSLYMSSLHASVCDALSLQALRIKPGKLQALPKNLSRLRNLTYFSMTGTTFFTSFPYAVFGLTNLQTLELDLRNVKKIPEGFAEFKYLKTLIFNEAQKIDELPEELSRLPQLDTISLSDTDNLSDVSALNKFNHPYTLILNRCNYLKIAKALAPFEMLNKMIVSKSIFKKDMEKLSSIIPANKLLLAQF